MARLVLASYLLLLGTTSLCFVEGVQNDKVDHVDCIDAYKNCRTHKQCRLSYRNIGSKCTVIEGRCSATMKHLPACDKIMKDIFTHGFPKNRCACDKNTPKCRDILEKIYSNPCFVSIRHLKKHNLFPHDVIATTATADAATTAQSQQTTKQNKVQKTPDHSRGRITTTLKVPTTKKATTIDGRKEEYGRDHKTKMWEKDETDYKLLTIIFATLLGLFILLVAIFFAWSGIKNVVLYTNGKKVSKGRPGSLKESDGKLSSNNNVSKD